MGRRLVLLGEAVGMLEVVVGVVVVVAVEVAGAVAVLKTRGKEGCRPSARAKRRCGVCLARARARTMW